MYSVLTNIIVQQIPTEEFPNRNLQIFIPFLSSYNGVSTWADQTQKMRLTLPKNVRLRAVGTNGEYYTLGAIKTSSSSIGGYVCDSPTYDYTDKPIPTFLRGDVITFDVGYRAKLEDGSEVTYQTGGIDPTKVYEGQIPNLFKGFISAVNPRLPFTIDCEDAMWLLGQIPTPTSQARWAGKSLQKITEEILAEAYKPVDGKESILAKYERIADIKITISDFSKTDLIFNVQNFWTRGESIRAMLGRIKHQYKLDSWFRNFELRIGLTHYIPDDAKEHKFTFQKNILDGDSLFFSRKDDVALSVIVRTNYGRETGRTTKDGKKIIKQESTEILVFSKTGKFTYLPKKKGVEFPPNSEGNRYTLNITTPETDEKKLFEWGVTFLKRYYYDGLKGSFTTFGVPYVKHGDVVELENGILPEMNGKYMVKAVEPNGGAENGLKQTITIDYKINSIADINTYRF